jgi:hypothetical protein
MAKKQAETVRKRVIEWVKEKEYRTSNGHMTHQTEHQTELGGLSLYPNRA